MIRSAFNNVLYKDGPHLDDEDTFYCADIPMPNQRIEEKPINIDSNYLYTDEDADRFNAPVSGEQHGQPRGIYPQLGPVKNFESSATDSDKEVFVDDFIKSSNNEDNLVNEIIKILGGL